MQLTRIAQLAGACLLFAIASCKKDDPAAASEVRYEQVTDMQINRITGFAPNGDMIAKDADRMPVRYRSAGGDWIRLGKNAQQDTHLFIDATAQDNQGTYFGACIDFGPFELRPGSDVWTRLRLPGTDSIDVRGPYNQPVGNAAGAVALQVRAVLPGRVIRERVYYKPANSDTWAMVHERADNAFSGPLRLAAVDASGDIIFQQPTELPPLVLRSGSGTISELIPCGGSVILPYCKFMYTLSPAGHIVFSQGGTGSRKMFRLDKKPAVDTARYLYELPEGACSFFQANLLDDGTFMGIANDCAYSQYRLYIRRPGADAWQLAPALPGYPSVQVVSNFRGEVFTTSQMTAFGVAPVYRVRF